MLIPTKFPLTPSFGEKALTSAIKKAQTPPFSLSGLALPLFTNGESALERRILLVNRFAL